MTCHPTRTTRWAGSFPRRSSRIPHRSADARDLVVGVLLAGLASDLVAHMIVHNTLPSAPEFRHMLAVSSRALGVLVIPLIAVGLAVLDVIADRTSLVIAITALIISLAVHVALGVLVVFLEALVH